MQGTMRLVAILLLLTLASSALAGDPESDPVAKQSFRSFHWIKAWAPRTQPIDIGDLTLWERHFPARTCTWRKQAVPVTAGDIAIFSSCPAYVGSRRISFEFHGKAGETDLYLKRASVDGKELSVQEYEAFIDHPFTTYGSYQTVLPNNDRMGIAFQAGVRDIASIDRFFSSAEDARYSCFVTDQSNSAGIAVFCFVDAHDPEDAEYAEKHRPFIVGLQRAGAAWIVRAIHFELESIWDSKAVLRFLIETIGLIDR
jgi:hypothetical protein